MRCRSALTRIDALRTRRARADERRQSRAPQDLPELQRVDLRRRRLARRRASRWPWRRPLLPRRREDCLRRLVRSRRRRVGRVLEERRPDGHDRRVDRRNPRAVREALRTRARAGARFPARCASRSSPRCRAKASTRRSVDLEPTNDLEHDVLQTLTRIPRGQVRTYAWVARQVGRPRAVRAVGNIIARNVVPFVVPCHRVVPSAGGVGNYIFGSDDEARAAGARRGRRRRARRRWRASTSATSARARRSIFCFPTCRDARRIQEKNRVPFRDADEALEGGYRPCRSCQPVVAAIERRPRISTVAAPDVYAVSIPARTFTGDFWFTHRTDDRLWFALGDVAGKGLPAALVMAMIQEELEQRINSCARAGCDPATTMQRLHAFLRPLLPRNRFATVVIGWLRDDGTLDARQRRALSAARSSAPTAASRRSARPARSSASWSGRDGSRRR